MNAWFDKLSYTDGAVIPAGVELEGVGFVACDFGDPWAMGEIAFVEAGATQEQNVQQWNTQVQLPHIVPGATTYVGKFYQRVPDDAQPGEAYLMAISLKGSPISYPKGKLVRTTLFRAEYRFTIAGR